ncbi:MAG: hypothetical protein M3O87_07365 [Candidatus Dormibacteraeota bacterium]|nr:hypothetical protein [Candidatus Dormibacteraeota bacterium]
MSQVLTQVCIALTERPLVTSTSSAGIRSPWVGVAFWRNQFASLRASFVAVSGFA